jgi:hypothetical protein
MISAEPPSRDLSRSLVQNWALWCSIQSVKTFGRTGGILIGDSLVQVLLPDVELFLVRLLTLHRVSSCVYFTRSLVLCSSM